MTRTTLSHRTARRARSAASTAALCLSAFALAACSGGAAGDATASADAPVESAASDAGGSATTAEGSSSGASGESSGSTDGESSSSSAGGSGGVASGSYLTEPGPVATGDLAKTGGYGILTEPGSVDEKTASADTQTLSDSDTGGYAAACDEDMTLGGDPVPCAFTKDGEAPLKGESVYVRIAGGKTSVVISHVIGSDGKDPSLAASGDTELLVSYHGQDAAGPDTVKDDGLAEDLVQAYGWNFGDGEPMPERVKATCKVEEGGLHATCTLTGADDKSDGEYTATYQPGDDGRPLYVFTPSAPQ